MSHSIINNQDILAENFVLQDVLTHQASSEAVLRVKRWKFIIKIPGLGNRLKAEADNNIKKSLFSYVSNTYVLIEEGYYFASNDN